MDISNVKLYIEIDNTEELFSIISTIDQDIKKLLSDLKELKSFQPKMNVK